MGIEELYGVEKRKTFIITSVNSLEDRIRILEIPKPKKLKFREVDQASKYHK